MVALFRNDGKGQFADVTLASGLKARGWGMGTCIADYDSDGFQDVYVTAFGPNVLFRNNGDGTFTDTTAPAEVGDTRWSTNCAFGDYDRDGNLDLYVANYLSFSELTIAKRGASPNCKYMGIDVMCGPQGLPGEPDALYRNNGDGTFTDVSARRHRRSRPLRLRRALLRSGRRRLARHLRGERFGSEPVVSQQRQTERSRRSACGPASP